ncbi:MAG: DUF4258 domain-containing protein [Chloroflexota bacterium]|nr:DUF4258 domain-containing protein [Chloroflexota bacterium]
MNYRLTEHARSEMIRREIPSELLRRLMEEPEQVVPTFGGRNVYQSKMQFGEDKTYLLRAIVDDQTQPPTVVTVYRTSSIRKYWRV